MFSCVLLLEVPSLFRSDATMVAAAGTVTAEVVAAAASHKTNLLCDHSTGHNTNGSSHCPPPQVTLKVSTALMQWSRSLTRPVDFVFSSLRTFFRALYRLLSSSCKSIFAMAPSSL